MEEDGGGEGIIIAYVIQSSFPVYLCHPLPSRIAQWFQHHMSCLFTISRLARDMEGRGKSSANEDGPDQLGGGGRRETRDGRRDGQTDGGGGGRR